MSKHSVIPVSRSNKKGRDPLEFYETPVRATKALLNILGTPPIECWEPCVGTGAIAKVLANAGTRVISGDIKDYGYPNTELVDVLKVDKKRSDVVITNPPYRISSHIIRHLKYLGVTDIWMPLRLNYVEGSTRHDLFSDSFSGVYVFTKRIDFGNSEEAKKQAELNKPGGALTMAWFNWSTKHTGKATISHINDI